MPLFFTVFLFLFLILLLILSIIFLAVFLVDLRNLFFKEAPFVPSSKKLVQAMLGLAELKQGERVYDLGCGDGRIVIAAAKKYGVLAVGIEKSLGIYWLACFRNFIAGSPAKIARRDMQKIDLSQADVIFCYLWPDYMDRLENKFKQELKSGARVVSQSFEIKSWPARKKEKIGKRTVYLYQV